MRTTKLSSLGAVLVCTAALSIGSSPAHAGTTGIYCDPTVNRYYTQTSWSWLSYDGGTIDNRNSGATLTKVYTHSSSYSYTTQVSAEVGVSAGVAVWEINAKLGVGVQVTGNYEYGTQFTVSAPPWTYVSYRDGVIQRTFSVRNVRTYSNCSTSTWYGTVWAADNYSTAT